VGLLSLSLMEWLYVLYLWAQRNSAWLLAAGMTGIGIANLWRWLRYERQMARRPSEPAPESPKPTCTPRVSILIAGWEEAHAVEACAESVLALRYPNRELVMCLGGSDDTLQIAQRYREQGVIVLEQYPGEGKQHALQRCFERSSGDIIYLTDADCVLDDDCFERVVGPIACGQEQVTTGSRRPLNSQVGNALVMYQCFHHAYREGLLPDYVDCLDGVNAAVRREALEQSGEFGCEAAIGTDYRLGRQLALAGYRIRFVRDSWVRTEYQASVPGYLRQQSRWFRNRFVLGAGVGDRAVLSHARAGVAALFMLGVPCVGGLGSKVLWGAWLSVFSHLALSQARMVRFSYLYRGLDVRPRWRYILLVPCMVVGWLAMARGLLEAFIPIRRQSW
jgi:cellulose synthase/poly-beta-1,6-N-acetylglucosamine synthase-like glycosyltransferase